MRFLVDANISPRVADLLMASGHDAEHAQDFDVLRVSDDMLLAFAASEDRIVVSADADFEALFSLEGLSEPSFIVFSSADHLRPDEQAAMLLEHLDSFAEELVSGAIVTIAGGRVTLRSLPVEASSGASGAQAGT